MIVFNSQCVMTANMKLSPIWFESTPCNVVNAATDGETWRCLNTANVALSVWANRMMRDGGKNEANEDGHVAVEWDKEVGSEGESGDST